MSKVNIATDLELAALAALGRAERLSDAEMSALAVERRAGAHQNAIRPVNAGVTDLPAAIARSGARFASAPLQRRAERLSQLKRTLSHRSTLSLYA